MPFRHSPQPPSLAQYSWPSRVANSLWNGILLLWDLGLSKVDLTDTSGSWGCKDSQWLQLQWSMRLSQLSITGDSSSACGRDIGSSWSGKTAQFVVDNMQVMSVLNATYSREVHMLHLTAARYNFWFSVIHIPGQLNGCYLRELCELLSYRSSLGNTLWWNSYHWVWPGFIQLFKEATSGEVLTTTTTTTQWRNFYVYQTFFCLGCKLNSCDICAFISTVLCN